MHNLHEDDDYRAPTGYGDPLRGCAWALFMLTLLVAGGAIIGGVFFWVFG